MVDEDGEDEVRKAHAGENKSGQRPERPQGHLELAVRFPRALHREDQAEGCRDETDPAESTKDDEKNSIRQGGLLSIC